MLLLAKKLFGKCGVIAWAGVATVLANVVTAKSVDMLGLSTTIGNVLFASVFLATDILSECYTEADAKKAVYIGLFADAMLIMATQIALRYIPNDIDYAHGAMETLFTLNLRISMASALMFFISNMADVLLFNRIKRHGGKLWVRNNVSTILCNCLENFGFIALAFWGIYEVKDILIIAASTSVIEMAVAILDTPFLYLARKVNHGDEQRGLETTDNSAVH